MPNLNLDEIIEGYKAIKRNKHIVANIDVDYYLSTVEYFLTLLQQGQTLNIVKQEVPFKTLNLNDNTINNDVIRFILSDNDKERDEWNLR